MEVSPQENGATISSTYKTVCSLGSAIITVQYYHAKDPNSINPNIHCSLANNILTQMATNKLGSIDGLDAVRDAY